MYKRSLDRNYRNKKIYKDSKYKRGMTVKNESSPNNWNPIATAILGTDDSAKFQLK